MKNLTLGIALVFSLAISASSFAAITSNKVSFEISDKDKEKKKKKSCCSGEGKDKKCSSSK